MRNNILYISLLGSFLFGCDDFLQEDLQGTYSNSTFYQTEEHAELALTGVYNAISFSDVRNNLWVFGDVASDDAVKGGQPGDQNDIQFIDEFSYQPSNSYLNNIWKHYYEGITRANYLLASMPAIDMDETRKGEIEGEALFLRSYFYFHLVNLFGEVPLKLKPPLTSDQIHVALSSVETIYSQIDEDLETAAALLPSDADGRATAGAAWGLLAKSRLFQEDYQGALDAISELDAATSYGLVSLYTDNFTLGNQDNQETVFSIRHLSGTSPKLGAYLNQYFAPQTENGYFFNTPTQDFVDEFEVTSGDVVDPRLDYSLGREGSTWLNGESYDPTWSPTGFIGKKHLQPLSEVPKGTKGDGGLDYVFMRYAEVLLMKAEALNELNRGAEALAPLNEVRKRARESYLFDESLSGFGAVPAELLADVATTDKNQLREAIRHERRVELGLEFHRFYDLMRYGEIIAEGALSSSTNFSYEEHRYFVLPLAETDINQAIN